MEKWSCCIRKVNRKREEKWVVNYEVNGSCKRLLMGDESCTKSGMELLWFKMKGITVGQNYIVEWRFYPKSLANI